MDKLIRQSTVIVTGDELINFFAFNYNVEDVNQLNRSLKIWRTLSSLEMASEMTFSSLMKSNSPIRKLLEFSVTHEEELVQVSSWEVLGLLMIQSRSIAIEYTQYALRAYGEAKVELKYMLLKV